MDFSAEMERALSVLDYAVLVISAADGVQAHTRTVWKLLWQYNIPTFIFVNKMDQIGADKERIMEALQRELSGCCVDFVRMQWIFMKILQCVMNIVWMNFLKMGK